jgi:hypothetical protein
VVQHSISSNAHIGLGSTALSFPVQTLLLTLLRVVMLLLALVLQELQLLAVLSRLVRLTINPTALHHQVRQNF